MKKLMSLGLLCVLLVALTGCKKNEDQDNPELPPATEVGAIFVTVAYGGQPVAGAVITTDPESTEIVTDQTGTALIENLPEGIYQVFATLEEFGSGSGAADVDAGEVSDVIVYLTPGVFEGLAVNIFSVFPNDPIVGESVNIDAAVNDEEDEGNEISFEWSTDIDGLISTEGVGISGSYASIEYVFETPGMRTLTVTVTDTDGNTDVDSTIINVEEPPDPVVLEPIEAVGNTLHLNWSATEDEDDFVSYRIYRESQSGFTQISSIYDINTTTYIDENVSIGVEYNYQIGLYLGGGGGEYMSNIETGIFDEDHIDIGTGLDMLLHHPNNPTIYGLDTDNNSLVVINTELDEVVNTIYVGSSPVDMDFSLDNQLLYIANSGSTEISVVDVATATELTPIYVETGSGSWDGNPTTLAFLGDGVLAFADDDNSYVRVADITNGNNLTTTGEYFNNPYLLANSDGSILFISEMNYSQSQLHRYERNFNYLNLQESSNDFSIQSRQIFLTENEQYIFCGTRKFQAANLANIVGTFSDNIYAINADGTRALGEDRLYNGETFNTIEVLPVSTEISVFSNDGTTAYLFYEPLARLYKITVE